MSKRTISSNKAIAIFMGYTAYFYLLLLTLFPYLKLNYSAHPAVYWFITAYCLFIPLFLHALVAVSYEGNRTWKGIQAALNIKPLTGRDWRYALGGLGLTFLFSGIIFGVSFLLNHFFDLPMLNTTPWFMEMKPFQGWEKLLLLVWLPMFFFNIVGEEILWRGYIQNRLKGRYSWLLCSLLWLIFHLPFGIDLLIMLVPIILILPYSFYKTRNTTVGIFMHGIYNGPIFVAIALGIVEK